MKLIGLTQRVDVIAAHGERRDCLDQRWTCLIESLGCQPVPLSNTVARADDYLVNLGVQGIILTGGNDLSHLRTPRDPAPERDRFEKDILRTCIARKIPVLGVCRGMQIINHYFGGQLQRAPGHVATRHRVRLRAAGVTSPDVSAEVNSFHDYAIPDSGLGETLKATAWADDGSVEAFSDESSLVLGIMWHPEREPRLPDRDALLMKGLFSCGLR